MSALIAVAPASSRLAAPPARRRASPRPPARAARLRGLRRFSPPRSAALGTNPEPMGAGAAIPADETDLPAMRQACLRVATDAAKRGATIMLEKLGADVVKTKANARDLLTEVDPEVQRIIEGTVSEAFPTHRFLGEESVPPGAEASAAALAELLDSPGGDENDASEGGGSDWLWVVDPIDGTTNFCHSMPLSAISIGVAYRGELQVAVIMDPFAGEIFSASKGRGAYCNFAQMRVGEEATGEESVVVTGYGATAESADAMIKGMKALTALPVRSIRMLGSAAIMLAWVAAGRLTAYYECDLNSWDTAAGALLVREAGGEMTDLVTGEAYSLRTRAILASNGKTHEEIRTCLIEGGVRALKDYEEARG
jgi:myo-inositol-1(or 4)-monophosphatase